MTLIRFKLFKISLIDSRVVFDPTFDKKMADYMFGQEERILAKLTKKDSFRLVRIIPDELPYYFWGISSGKAATSYVNNLKKSCAKRFPKTKIYRITELLQNPKLKKLYDETFKSVCQSFDKEYKSILVSPKMFRLEVNRRSLYYSSTPLPTNQAMELARKSFALFAAEVALLYQLQQDGVFPNITILGRKDALDEYKYEFFRVPQNRPVFPKLFII